MSSKIKLDRLIELGYVYNGNTGEVISPSGRVLNTINDRYKIIRLRKYGINIYHHQFAWYYINREVVDCIDHINGDRLDNRIQNLRSVTKQQNQFNRNRTKGYSFRKDKNLYQSRIKLNGRLISLGYYDNEIEAHQAYLDAKKMYHMI